MKIINPTWSSPEPNSAGRTPAPARAATTMRTADNPRRPTSSAIIGGASAVGVHQQRHRLGDTCRLLTALDLDGVAKGDLLALCHVANLEQLDAVAHLGVHHDRRDEPHPV